MVQLNFESQPLSSDGIWRVALKLDLGEAELVSLTVWDLVIEASDGSILSLDFEDLTGWGLSPTRNTGSETLWSMAAYRVSAGEPPLTGEVTLGTFIITPAADSNPDAGFSLGFAEETAMTELGLALGGAERVKTLPETVYSKGTSGLEVTVSLAARPSVPVPGVSWPELAEIKTGDHGAVVWSNAVDTDGEQDGRVIIVPGKAPPSEVESAGITLTDVLGALKVYLDKPLDPSYDSPFSYVAADFDGSGVVDLSDVLGLLKYYLGKPTAAEPSWVFANAALDGLPASATPNQVISKHHATPAPVSVDLTSEVPVALVGILRGDVDGSWLPIAN